MAGGRKSREEEEWQGENRSSEEENDGIGAGDRGAARRGGAAQRRALAERSNTPVEEVYQKKSQLEHILLRPDTYVGSTEKVPHTAHVPEDTGPDGETVMTQRQLTLSPGLYKIFDEVLVNAADNKVRDPKGMKELRVHIDQRRGSVSVFNDGRGIDVEVHREEGVYVPELIFGHLLTSSNYNDSERKVTGGRNGFGAKLANIFSTEFVVETADGSRKKQYKQVFNSNMQRKTEPTIKTCRASDNWTKITFTPDLQRFQMDHLEDGVVQLMSKRVYDIAGTIGKDTKVYLNNYKIPIKGFADYVDLFLKHKPDCPKIHERVNDRWEVCISASEGQQQNVSFVNSINTTRGGSHVTHIADQIATKMLEKMPKKDKVNLKPLHVKNNLFIFVNCLIENPAFDSQTKETLTTRQNAFGSKCEISDQIINKIMKSQIKDNVLSLASQKQSKELKKSDGAKRDRLSGVPKLDDANDAGTKKSEECTLILTEGDSAKALAVAGLSVLGRDKFGVFPLRGKLLNVRDASHQQVMNNAEITNLKQILGLQQGKAYKDAKSLRYGHVMIMTDQDHDGSHIKGLLINFFHHFFPSLLKISGFLLEFITPLVKASKGRQKKVFYSMPEYEEWRDRLGNSPQGWSIKYYKGLGTSTSAEAKEYFAALTDHRKVFTYDGEKDDEAITMAFSKKKAEERKDWLNNHIASSFLDQNTREIKYSDFINKELIQFSLADLQRSIPSLMDGLKTSQRKVMYGAFKKKIKSEIKVAQLSGYVSEHSAYHHGEASLASTIVSLAQDFVGSNNISLLHPAGQFGTRLQGGKDHASSRYIFTRMGQLTRNMFMESDERLLKYQYDDGQRIEPEYYLPILPLALVNGCEGIGTGWSTNIPNYNPRDVAANIKRLINEEETLEMTPWYRGFKGEIEKKQSGRSGTRGDSFETYGIIEQTDNHTLEITELPIRFWTQDYKEFLESLVKPGEKGGEPQLQEYKEYHTDTSVHFVLSLSDEQMRAALNEGLYKRFRLTTKLSTSNMHLFNEDGTITRYTTPSEVLHSFFDVRMRAYTRRREILIEHAKQNLKRATNKVRFIQEVVDGERLIARKKKEVLEAELERDGFDKMPKHANVLAVDEESEENEESSQSNVGYDYLLSMPLWTLTQEKIEELEQQKQDDARQLALLEETSASTLWTQDIDNFLEALDAHEREEANAASKQRKRPMKKGRANKAYAEDEDDEDFAGEGAGPRTATKKADQKPRQQQKKTKQTTLKKEDFMKKPSNKPEDSDGRMEDDTKNAGVGASVSTVADASQTRKSRSASERSTSQQAQPALASQKQAGGQRVTKVGIQRNASDNNKTSKRAQEEEIEDLDEFDDDDEDEEAAVADDKGDEFDFGGGSGGGPALASQSSEARSTRASNRSSQHSKLHQQQERQKLQRIDSDSDNDFDADDDDEDFELPQEATGEKKADEAKGSVPTERQTSAKGGSTQRQGRRQRQNRFGAAMETEDVDDAIEVEEADDHDDEPKATEPKQRRAAESKNASAAKATGLKHSEQRQQVSGAKSDDDDDDEPGSLMDRMAARFGRTRETGQQEVRSPGKTKRTGMNKEGGASAEDAVLVDDTSPGPDQSPAYPPKKRRAL